LFCLTLTACQRPVAYFQRTPHAPAARLIAPSTANTANDLQRVESIRSESADVASPVLTASTNDQLPVKTSQQIHQRVHRVNSLLTSSTRESINVIDQQPKPKPKPKMKLGNRIRDALGMPLREELNWWQRISWKLKASVIIILVAVLFAILHITILAIIFGIVAAFLLISGLRRSFKVRRPWF
jgi:Flp pilus assembly protein TadB